jgi:hypothetical protein
MEVHKMNIKHNAIAKAISDASEGKHGNDDSV